MSEINLGQIKGLTVNNNVVTVPSGHTLYAPGHVIQTVQNVYSTSFSTNSTSLVDTGLSASITPKFTTSKILVLVNQPGFFYYASGNQEVVGTLVRNSTIVAGIKSQINVAGQSYLANNFQFQDSPTTTSTITYKTQVG